MKVAIVTDKLNLGRGGAERSVFDLACELRRQGSQVTVLAESLAGMRLEESGIAFEQIPIAGRDKVARWQQFCPKVAGFLGQSSFDIVHSVVPLAVADVYQPRGGCLAWNVQRHCLSYEHPLCVRWKQLTSGWNRSRTVRIAAERSLCTTEKGPVIAALSDYVKEQFQHLYHMSDERVRVIRSGIAVDGFVGKESGESAAAIRRRLGCDESTCLFLFAAENARLKGLPWLCRSIAALPNDVLECCRFAFLSRRETNFVRRQVHVLEPRASVYVGQAGGGEMSGWYGAADVIVLPSWHDACSRVVLEGLAAGKSAITTRFNGASDFLDGGKYGFVLDSCGDTPALAELLGAMVDPDVRRRFRVAIRESDLAEQVSIGRHVEELLGLYKDILDGR